MSVFERNPSPGGQHRRPAQVFAIWVFPPLIYAYVWWPCGVREFCSSCFACTTINFEGGECYRSINVVCCAPANWWQCYLCGDGLHEVWLHLHVESDVRAKCAMHAGCGCEKRQRVWGDRDQTLRQRQRRCKVMTTHSIGTRSPRYLCERNRLFCFHLGTILIMHFVWSRNLSRFWLVVEHRFSFYTYDFV